jgi:hypothetical protein
MRIYIIGNDGITLCREPPAAVNEGWRSAGPLSGGVWECHRVCGNSLRLWPHLTGSIRCS